MSRDPAGAEMDPVIAPLLLNIWPVAKGEVGIGRSASFGAEQSHHWVTCDRGFSSKLLQVGKSSSPEIRNHPFFKTRPSSDANGCDA
jgi:hypothetical protein